MGKAQQAIQPSEYIGLSNRNVASTVAAACQVR